LLIISQHMHTDRDHENKNVFFSCKILLQSGCILGTGVKALPSHFYVPIMIDGNEIRVKHCISVAPIHFTFNHMSYSVLRTKPHVTDMRFDQQFIQYSVLSCIDNFE